MGDLSNGNLLTEWMAKYFFLDFPGRTEQSFEELFWEQNNFPQIIQILYSGHNVLQGHRQFLGGKEKKK